MYKVLIVAPNCGYDLAFGGGTFVALSQAKVLLDQGARVCLAALQGLPLNRLAQVHGIPLRDESMLHTRYIFNLNTDNLLPIPYPVGVQIFGRFFNSLVRTIKPDIVIFHDDALKSSVYTCKSLGSKTLLYMHLSYVVRAHHPKFIFRTHTRPTAVLLTYFAYAKSKFENDFRRFNRVIANSTVTAELTRSALPDCDTIGILHPPVTLPTLSYKDVVRKKKMWITHAAQQDKAFLLNDLITALDLLSKAVPDARLFLTRCSARTIKKLSSFGNAIPAILPERTCYEELLLRSRIYAHFNFFETFGIASVEGMAYGAVPVSFVSRYNATWMDILDKGRFGYGFRTPQEFVDIVCVLMTDGKSFRTYSRGAFERSKVYSYSNFATNFLKHIAKM